MNFRRFAGIVLLASTTLVACDKDDADNLITPYTVPATYSFDNVDYTAASQSVAMWQGLTGYLGRSTTRQLSQDTANFLWNNTNNAFTSETTSNLPFTAAELNASSVKLASLTSEPAVIKALIDSMVVISQYHNSPASEGVPGRMLQSNRTTVRVFNHTGLEFNQAVAKGLMGSLVLKKIFEHLDRSTTANNLTVVPGKGTDMQHEWDMAFGYLAIPKDYDTSKAYPGSDANRPLALGGYLRERGQYIKAGGVVYEAFRKGRAAIAAKDYQVRDQQIAVIKDILERTIAAAAYEYVRLPQGSNDLAARMHNLSEGLGFAIALKNRPANSKLTEANYQGLLGIMSTSFYTLLGDPSFAKLKQAQGILSGAYGPLQAN